MYKPVCIEKQSGPWSYILSSLSREKGIPKQLQLKCVLEKLCAIGIDDALQFIKSAQVCIFLPDPPQRPQQKYSSLGGNR